MIVKLLREGRTVNIYECTHVEIRRLEMASKMRDEFAEDGDDEPGSLTGGRTGIEIDICPGPTIHLPTDGDEVYMSSGLGGKTIDHYSWPERPKNILQQT